MTFAKKHEHEYIKDEVEVELSLKFNELERESLELPFHLLSTPKYLLSWMPLRIKFLTVDSRKRSRLFYS